MPISPRSKIPGVTLVDLWKRYDEAALPDPRPKRWHARVRDPLTGKEVTKSFEDGKKDDATAWGEKERARLLAEVSTVGRADMVAVGDECLSNLRAAGMSASHIGKVQWLVNALRKEGIRDMKSPLFLPRMQRWVESRPVAKATQLRLYRQIRAIVHHAMKRGLLMMDPLAVWMAPKVPKKLKATFTLEELRKMVSKDRVGSPYFLRAVLLIYSGCRIGEALALGEHRVERG